VRAVTPDANLYISALIWNGKPEQLLEMALARKVRLFISDAIMDEVVEVLEEKFNHSPKRLALEKQYLSKCTVRCVPKIKLDVVKDDPEDNKIVECAVHSRSEAIITNDDDLLRMKSYDGIRMLKVHEFLREGPERGR
jgi:putative PIN family toxin of toxin-antitoxin system